MSGKTQTFSPWLIVAILAPLALVAVAYVLFQSRIEKVDTIWFGYGLCFLVGVLMTCSAVYALKWASRRGQLRDFEKGAASIFDETEPVGRFTDSFPGQKVPPALSAAPRKA